MMHFLQLFFFLNEQEKKEEKKRNLIKKNPLFKNKRFLLDEMFQQNASKLAIILEYENPCSFFIIPCYFIFYPMKALVYVDIDQGIH